MKDFIVYINEKLKVTKKMLKSNVYTKDDFENITHFSDVYEKHIKKENITLTFGDIFSGPNKEMSKFLCCYCVMDFEFEKRLFIIVNDNLLEGVLSRREYEDEMENNEMGFCKIPDWLDDIVNKYSGFKITDKILVTYEDFLDESTIVSFYDDLKIPLTKVGKKLLNK